MLGAKGHSLLKHGKILKRKPTYPKSQNPVFSHRVKGPCLKPTDKEQLWVKKYTMLHIAFTIRIIGNYDFALNIELFIYWRALQIAMLV